MEIQVNDTMLEYQLEDEKKLGDVMNTLEEWVTKNGNVIHSVYVDDQNVPFDYHSSEFQQDIEIIGRLRIVTSSRAELAVNTVQTVGEYIIHLLENCLKEEDYSSHDSILEGVKLVREGMADSLRVLKIREWAVIDRKGRSLSDIFSQMDQFVSTYESKYIDHEGINKLKKSLKELLYLLPKVFKWAVVKNYYQFGDKDNSRKPEAFIKDVFDDLRLLCSDSVKKFEMIGKNIQTGNDIEAMHELCFITELMDEVLSLHHLIKHVNRNEPGEADLSERKVEEIFKKTQNKLEEIENAFKNQDMISVGDIVEYELEGLFRELVKVTGDMYYYI
ncbi:MAG: hypothetical protein ACOC7U_03570 [Spirochaetota bacterium]